MSETEKLEVKADELDMDLIVKILREERDVFAYVEQTGGGCATIYAGPRWRRILAGPGWFKDSSFQNPKASKADFYVGPDSYDVHGNEKGEDQEHEDGPWEDERAVAKAITRWVTADGEHEPDCCGWCYAQNLTVQACMVCDRFEEAADAVHHVRSLWAAAHGSRPVNLLGGPNSAEDEDRLCALERWDRWLVRQGA